MFLAHWFLGCRVQIVYCCWLVFEFVFLYFMVVETKNRTLEETAALFDGDDIAQHIGQPVQDVKHDDYDEKASA